MFSAKLESASGADDITREAVERLKTDVPDLCMWIYASKGINESSGLPDTFENTVSTMQLLVEMLATEKREDLCPSGAQRRGWDAAMLAKRRDTGALIEEVDTTTARIRTSIANLNEAAKELAIAKTLVEFKYQETFAQLEQISDEVLAGGYAGPGEETNRLMAGIHRQVEATGAQRRAAQAAQEAEEEMSSDDDSSDSSSSSGSSYSSSSDGADAATDTHMIWSN